MTHPSHRKDKSAPMAAAPIRYRDDGAVDWGNMWDSFCDLAQEGGPPHRGTMLYAGVYSDPASEGYQTALTETIRGIEEVSGLKATAAPQTGWIAIPCYSPDHAAWLAEAITAENVEARHEGATLFVPCGDYFTVKGEIKSVITAVAKTTHYWIEHLPPDAKTALKVQLMLTGWWQKVKGLFAPKSKLKIEN